jgi:hypothetical protein
LTAVFSEDCSALTAALSDVFGGGIVAAPANCFWAVFARTGDSSDARDGIDPASDLSLEFVRAGFSGVLPCFKKAYKGREIDE